MVDFRFMYEHKAREMESLALICSELKRRRYSFDFYPCNGMGGHPKKKAKVLVVPYLYQDMHIVSIKRYLGDSKKIVNLQWEQIFSVSSDGNPAYVHYPKGETVKSVHLCWGPKEKDSLIKSGVNKNDLKVVGPIHLDFVFTVAKR